MVRARIRFFLLGSEPVEVGNRQQPLDQVRVALFLGDVRLVPRSFVPFVRLLGGEEVEEEAFLGNIV